MYAAYPATFSGLGDHFGLAAARVAPAGPRLNPGEELRTGEKIYTTRRRGELIMQTDGNLVYYDVFSRPIFPLWNSGVHPGANVAAMQTDGNFVVYARRGNQQTPVWATNTAGNPGAYLELQDDGNMVLYRRDRVPLWNSNNAGWTRTDTVDVNFFEAAGDVIGDVLPIAQTIISFVPGIGQGINAAIAAGVALARGESIGDAIVSAAKNALPGGPVAAAAFDAAYAAGKAIADGKNIGDAALAATRAALPSEEAKRAFDVGLAVVQGQNVQQALVRATASLAPAAAKVAAEIFQRPELLKLPLAEAAALLHSDPATVATASAAIKSNAVLATPPVKKLPPALKAPPKLTPSPRLVANLAAVARKNPKATDAEVLYASVAGDSVLTLHASKLSPKLISNMIAVARAYPQAKDAEVLYVASITPPAQKPVPPKLVALKPPVATTPPKPIPAAPPTVAQRGTYAPYPKMVA